MFKLNKKNHTYLIRLKRKSDVCYYAYHAKFPINDKGGFIYRPIFLAKSLPDFDKEVRIFETRKEAECVLMWLYDEVDYPKNKFKIVRYRR